MAKNKNIVPDKDGLRRKYKLNYQADVRAIMRIELSSYELWPLDAACYFSLPEFPHDIAEIERIVRRRRISTIMRDDPLFVEACRAFDDGNIDGELIRGRRFVEPMSFTRWAKRRKKEHGDIVVDRLPHGPLSDLKLYILEELQKRPMDVPDLIVHFEFLKLTSGKGEPWKEGTIKKACEELKRDGYLEHKRTIGYYPVGHPPKPASD